MPGITVITSKAQFDEAIAGDPLAVIYYCAEWCGPCKFIAPKIKAMAEQFPNVRFFKVDIDVVKELSHGIAAVPTFHFFKSKTMISEIRGADENLVKKEVEKHQ